MPELDDRRGRLKARGYRNLGKYSTGKRDWADAGLRLAAEVAV
jgi:hypothetical protein